MPQAAVLADHAHLSSIDSEIDEIVNLGLAPFLAKLGFDKDSRTFYRQYDDRIEVLEVKASPSNGGSDATFTVNLGVFFPRIREISGVLPTVVGLPKEYDCTVRERIGNLMPKPGDHSWSVTDTTEIIELAKSVIAVVDKLALPWLQEMSNLDSVREVVAAQNKAFVAAAISLFVGDRAGAREFLSEYLRQQPRSAVRAKAWGQKQGLIGSG